MPIQYRHCTVLLPLMVRLKHPSLSPDRESDPHCKTTALGWNVSITLDITYTRNLLLHTLHRTVSQQHSNIHVSKWHEDIPSVPTAADSPILVTLRPLRREAYCWQAAIVREEYRPNQSPQKLASWATQWQSMNHKESLSKVSDIQTYRLEYCFIGLIIDSIPEGIVDSVVLAFACTNILLEWKTGETTNHQRTNWNTEIVLQIRNGSLGFHQCNLNVNPGFVSWTNTVLAEGSRRQLTPTAAYWQKWVHWPSTFREEKSAITHCSEHTGSHFPGKGTFLHSNKTGSQNSSSKPVCCTDVQPKIPVWANCAA